jgi:hypothetical protein
VVARLPLPILPDLACTRCASAQIPEDPAEDASMGVSDASGNESTVFDVREDSRCCSCGNVRNSAGPPESGTSFVNPGNLECEGSILTIFPV